MHYMIDIEYFNKLIVSNRSFKSIVRLTQYGHLKRVNFSEYDLETLVPSYEAFAQLVGC